MASVGSVKTQRRPMDATPYLKRIGFAAEAPATAETLDALQRAHLFSVPFENLDIPRGIPIRLDLDLLYEKVVVRRRGGFCYELNGLFAWLLGELGFVVTLLSARVARQDGTFGPEFDHLALMVLAPGGDQPGPWLVDVGFGEGFLEPLPLRPFGERGVGRQRYRLVPDGPAFIMQQVEAGESWRDRYRFTLAPRRLLDFAAMCRYHQSSPDSSFTRGRLCTLATPNGRLTLSEEALIVTEDGRRQEQPITSAEYEDLLARHFGITLAWPI